MFDPWQKTPATLQLSAAYIDIWFCQLQQLATDINKFYALLTDKECQRAERLKIEWQRQQFVITRGYLRQRLAWLIGTEPKAIAFTYLEHGKPVLNQQQQHSGITFNVSHTQGLALIAISQENSIGIDIETVNRSIDIEKLVQRFFSSAEQAEFNTLPAVLRTRAFFACWARKEAFIKATGAGIAYGLDNFDVTVDPEIQTPQIMTRNSAGLWSALDLPVGDDYMACVVSNTSGMTVRYWY